MPSTSGGRSRRACLTSRDPAPRHRLTLACNLHSGLRQWRVASASPTACSRAATLLGQTRTQHLVRVGSCVPGLGDSCCQLQSPRPATLCLLGTLL